ncbi:MAG: SDR family oxidoreductase [Anaerolineales bacterium]
MNLKNKVVVITGSTRGFGNALARAVRSKGAWVVISGRRQADVDNVVAELGERTVGLACDVSIAEQVYALARFAVERCGRVDVWVNNAGITPPPGGVLDFPPEQAEQTFRVNCIGTLNGTQAALAVMKRQGHGTIVNLYGRGSDLKAATPSGLYGATKAWITSFTRSMASEYKDLPIRFIGFSPGMMTTDMLNVHEVVGQTVADAMRNFPMVLQALGNPPEVPAAQLVRLLETNDKPFVEYFFMRGWRLAKMLARLAWMGMNKQARPPQVELTVRPPFEPPL